VLSSSNTTLVVAQLDKKNTQETKEIKSKFFIIIHISISHITV